MLGKTRPLERKKTMNKPLFGPAGNGEAFYASGLKHTKDAFVWLREQGLDAYEYQCGNGVVGSEATFRLIGERAQENGIALSLHAPYFISLSGIDPEKRLKSVDYVRASLSAARAMGADLIVVHSGSAGKIPREEAMALARDTVAHILAETDHEGIRIGLETMGKRNQLGTLEEVIDLCKVGPGLVPVVDFGHLNARNAAPLFCTADDYRRVFDKIGCALGDTVARHLHCHFSKIEYTDAGEKRHLTFTDTVYGPPSEPLMEAVAAENLCPRIICESAGTQMEDARYMKSLWQTAYCAKNDEAQNAE
jgi:deoxyribonuclease-4